MVAEETAGGVIIDVTDKRDGDGASLAAALLPVEIPYRSESGLHPEYATADAAGADIKAAEHARLEPGERVMISTGLYFGIPPGYEAQVRPRSGIAWRHGVTVLNAPGTIDADYRGELRVILINHGTEAFEIARGDRIAQLIIAPVTHARFALREHLPESERGTGGFGSTGI